MNTIDRIIGLLEGYSQCDELVSRADNRHASLCLRGVLYTNIKSLADGQLNASRADQVEIMEALMKNTEGESLPLHRVLIMGVIPDISYCEYWAAKVGALSVDNVPPNAGTLSTDVDALMTASSVLHAIILFYLVYGTYKTPEDIDHLLRSAVKVAKKYCDLEPELAAQRHSEFSDCIRVAYTEQFKEINNDRPVLRALGHVVYALHIIKIAIKTGLCISISKVAQQMGLTTDLPLVGAVLGAYIGAQALAVQGVFTNDTTYCPTSGQYDLLINALRGRDTIAPQEASSTLSEPTTMGDAPPPETPLGLAASMPLV